MGIPTAGIRLHSVKTSSKLAPCLIAQASRGQGQCRLQRCCKSPQDASLGHPALTPLPSSAGGGEEVTAGIRSCSHSARGGPRLSALRRAWREARQDSSIAPRCRSNFPPPCRWQRPPNFTGTRLLPRHGPVRGARDGNAMAEPYSWVSHYRLAAN